MKRKYPAGYCNCAWNLKMKGKKRDLTGKPVQFRAHPNVGSGVFMCTVCEKNVSWS